MHAICKNNVRLLKVHNVLLQRHQLCLFIRLFNSSATSPPVKELQSIEPKYKKCITAKTPDVMDY